MMGMGTQARKDKQEVGIQRLGHQMLLYSFLLTTMTFLAGSAVVVQQLQPLPQQQQLQPLPPQQP